ncbi:MAG: hypothetical protein HY717_16160 [Planctomycetes bacterium]|nr:hypothetical protein [Planctomycetota bacterium]
MHRSSGNDRSRRLGIFCAPLFASGIWFAQEAPERLPAPDRSVQTAELERIKSAFKEEYSRRDAVEKAALAEKLFRMALAEKDSSTIYVLLKEAGDLAAQAGDAEKAFRAVDELAKRYLVNGVGSKLDLLPLLARSARTPAENKQLAGACLAAVSEAVAADQMEAAGSFIQTAISAAPKAKDPPLLAEAQRVKKELALLKAEFELYLKAQKTLAEKPHDPEASLAAGKYIALYKGDLEKALAPLSKGSDPVLKAVAEHELAKPADSLEQIALAGSWLELLEKGHALSKDRKKLPLQWYFLRRGIQGKARFWMEAAFPRLKSKSELELASRIESGTKEIQTETIGGNGGGAFSDRGEKPGLLIGLRISPGQWGGNEVLRAIQPIFFTAAGKVHGSVHGRAERAFKEFLAKPGYAVGALSVKGGRLVDGLKIIFQRLNGDKLDHGDSYESGWVGGRGGSPELELGSAGKTAIGLHGRCGLALDAIGLIFAP